MRLTSIVTVLLALAFASIAEAQTVSSCVPRSLQPGSTATVTLTGKDLGQSLRAITSTGSEVIVESAEAEKATLKITLPAETPLGPVGLWIATTAGPAEMITLLVDDLATIAEQGENHSVEAAQQINLPNAIDGASNGAHSDFFRFQANAGQRVAFEVLTQDLHSAMDPVVRLLDSSGSQLQLSDDDEVGPECRFSHTFETAGDYILEVRDNRFTAGGLYQLRIGDFPLVRHCFPLAAQRGTVGSVGFVTIDGSAAEAVDLTPTSEIGVSVSNVAGRSAENSTASWARLAISDWPQLVEPTPADESSSAAEPAQLPIGISGQLLAAQEKDVYRLKGVKDATFRFAGRTRSLGSRALVKMQLLTADGKKVAESPVNDSDEWSFDYKFPDDGEYELAVTDLLGRGGDGFGYYVDISRAGQFEISLKPDAKTPEKFPIPITSGACAIDLTVARFGYDGPIELSVDQAGLQILNPIIPAKAAAAKIYIKATDAWQADALQHVRIVGTAKDVPDLKAAVTSVALHRVKRPHVPFPTASVSGVLTLSAVAAQPEYLAFEPQAPLQFARQTTSHAGKLNLKRTNEAFKAAVTILGNDLPAGWGVSAKADKDSYTVNITRNDAANVPDAIPLLVYSEFEGKGRLTTANVPVAWIDPIAVQFHTVKPIIAGKPTHVQAAIQREGDDAQPATLKFTKLPDGWSAPESIAIAADSKQVESDFAIAHSNANPEPVEYQLTGKYQGADFTISGSWTPPEVVELPATLQSQPTEVALNGPQSRRQLIVTGLDAQQSPRDWTHDVTYTSAAPTIAEVVNGVIQAKADGQTQVTITIGDKSVIVPVTVTGTTAARHTHFESEVLVALSKQGCNSGACHGSPSGKGMFRLSLRAFDKKLDELTLIREDFGRRVNRIDPEQSLLLLKPLMKVNHGGGQQIRRDDPAYAILRDWIAEGAKADPPDVARCDRLEVYPNEKRILSLNGTQQLSVLAHFTDGSTRDVTHIAAYESSNMTVATVDHAGLISPVSRGESVILVRFLEHIEAVLILFVDRDPTFEFGTPPVNNYIDELAYAKLQQLQYRPSETCSDSEFLRRVYLDVIGILPSTEQSRAFLDATDPDKRSRLIDDLLARDEFAKFWALKWGDLLRLTGKSVGNEGVYKYHRWVEEAFRTNMPYDQFASELLSATGSTLSNPPANFYRTAGDMNDCVETISQVFLGARLQCAKCHNHPFERWTQDNYYGLGAFFNRLQRRNTQRPGEMFVYTSTSGEVTQPRTGQVMKPWLPAEGSIDVPADQDRRDALVDWLVKPDNPYFARIEANRIWSHCFSRGIVEPIDDFRASNPPSNGPLLDALAKDFAEHGFDRVHLLRTILNSRTYQASYETNDSNRDETEYFSHQQPRLLSAEQLLDALNHVTATSEPLGSLPADTKATQLPAPDLVKVDFLKTFGQPERSTVCACERVDDSNLGMAIELFNGPTVHKKLRDANNRFRCATSAGKNATEAIQELYLAAVCRYPSDAELQAALKHCETRENVADGLEDVCWALINTDEFLFQH